MGPEKSQVSVEGCPVSVRIPTFNRAKLRGRALSSVFPQTRRRGELIVVDAGSTDTTPQVLAGFAAKEKAVLRVLPQDKHGPATGLVGTLCGRYVDRYGQEEGAV